MAKKIYVSPSSQTDNKYVVGNTNEAVQCRKIAIALVKALERCGFEAKTNTTGDMYARTAESNKWGADLHLPIHTNAYNKNVQGTRIYCHDTTGEGYKASKAIMATLKPITPGTSDSINARDNLYEINKAKAPVAYIEVAFHDNEVEAQWVIDNIDAIAEAICKGVCNYYNQKFVEALIESVVESKPVARELFSMQVEMLKKGCYGDAVKALQILLKGNGCDCGNVDSDFGSKTEGAVKEFQSKNNLDADGICGPVTWAVLLGMK